MTKDASGGSARACAALAGVLAALACASIARAQSDASSVTVQEGDSCETIAERLYGEGAAGLAALHDANPELGPLPHHLVPGTTLRAPAPASITSIEHVVERRAPSATTFEPAQRGDALSRGTQVRTAESSSADLAFRDGAHVTVRERTLVIVYGGRRRLVERTITHAELERGALRSRLGELEGGRVEVATEAAIASLPGDGVVRVEDDGTSLVANHGSRDASITAEGERVVVPPDSGVVVHRGEHPSRPRRLLAAPRWLADRRGVVVGLVGEGAVLRGGFVPVEHAAGYRVEIARDARGADLVQALALDADASAFEARGIVDPVVYVSVASLDADGLEGRRSPWRAFSVRLARLVSPGGIDATLGAEAVPRVLPGTWLVAPPGLACRVGDAAPESIVTLDAPGTASIACADVAGLGEPALLEVDVAVPSLALDGTLVRDRSAAVTLALEGDPLPPVHTLVLRAPAGFEVGRLRARADGVLEAFVTTPPDASDAAALTVSLSVGSSYVDLETFSLVVVDPPALGAPAATPAPPRAPPRPLREARTVQSALGDLPWPSMLALRDERRGGLGAWVVGAVAQADGDPQVRVGGGASAEVPEVPLRFSLATAGDALHAEQPVDRRGSLDLWLGVGALLHDDGLLSVAIDASALLPTRPEPEGIGRVRLAPSVELGLRPDPWLTLRTRQGALLDAAPTGARLWAGALGADLTPARWLAFGVELDASAGHFVERDGAALALVVGAEARVEGVEIALASRIALDDDAARAQGAWSFVLALRFFSR